MHCIYQHIKLTFADSTPVTGYKSHALKAKVTIIMSIKTSDIPKWKGAEDENDFNTWVASLKSYLRLNKLPAYNALKTAINTTFVKLEAKVEADEESIQLFDIILLACKEGTVSTTIRSKMAEVNENGILLFAALKTKYAGATLARAISTLQSAWASKIDLDKPMEYIERVNLLNQQYDALLQEMDEATRNNARALGQLVWAIAKTNDPRAERLCSIIEKSTSLDAAAEELRNAAERTKFVRLCNFV